MLIHLKNFAQINGHDLNMAIGNKKSLHKLICVIQK
jgi:hypothetical protein